MSAANDDKKPAPTFSEIMNKSAASAMRGGTAGAVAMGANVAALMWMRTTVSLVSPVQCGEQAKQREVLVLFRCSILFACCCRTACRCRCRLFVVSIRLSTYTYFILSHY